MMIFADGAGDMGNLQNRKTNIGSRYFPWSGIDEMMLVSETAMSGVFHS